MEGGSVCSDSLQCRVGCREAKRNRGVENELKCMGVPQEARIVPAAGTRCLAHAVSVNGGSFLACVNALSNASALKSSCNIHGLVAMIVSMCH